METSAFSDLIRGIIVDWLEALKYLLLGLIQGITEVLPISSSGHVEFLKALIHIDFVDGMLFLVLVNTGSLVTFTIIYAKRIYFIIRDFLVYLFKEETREKTRPNFLLMVKLIIATIPAAIVGFVFGGVIDQLMVKYSVLISGIGLIFTGTVLFFVADKRITKGLTQITYLDAVLVGLAQSVALVPGISRSGMTSSTAINRGMGIDSALNFSFLMYIPISFGALILNVKDLVDVGVSVPDSLCYVYYGLALVAAAAATYVAYRFVFNIFISEKLRLFSYYCIALGFVSMGIFLFR